MVVPELITALPLLGVVTDTTRRVSFSRSVSLATTSISTAVPAAVVLTSSTAIGAVLGGVYRLSLRVRVGLGVGWADTIGTTVAASVASLSPRVLSARIRKSYSEPLVRPVTVWEVALVPPRALSGMSVQSETSNT